MRFPNAMKLTDATFGISDVASISFMLDRLRGERRELDRAITHLQRFQALRAARFRRLGISGPGRRDFVTRPSQRA
jgi:hypothetical protein